VIEISRSYTFKAPPARVWELLMNADALAACIPGCETLEPDGADRYVVALKVSMAAVMGRYTGSVQLVDKVPPTSYGLVVEGQGRAGFVKGSSSVTLTPAGEETHVEVRGIAQAGGAIARVGQRVMRAAAGLMMDRFFKRLQRRAEGLSEGDGMDDDMPEGLDDPAED
jgi:hypothetical protein